MGVGAHDLAVDTFASALFMLVGVARALDVFSSTWVYRRSVATGETCGYAA
jgi:hypothetical protein